MVVVFLKYFSSGFRFQWRWALWAGLSDQTGGPSRSNWRAFPASDISPPGFKLSPSLSTGVARMAAILSPHLHRLPISSISYPTESVPQGWPGRRHAGRKPARPAPVVRVAPLSSAIIEPLIHQDSLYVLADAGAGYSLASYYTSLGLFVISVPGLWSLIKRSVKSKVVQKTFITEGEGKGPNQIAGEILSFFTRNNFVVVDRGEAITFEGMMTPSRGQAALLTFCTCISLASVALVLTITVPDLGNNWFWLTSLSPLAGLYYWRKASRKEQIKVKMTVEEDGNVSEITVRGDDQQVEQVRKELGLSEKGMVYVKGLFERE